MSDGFFRRDWALEVRRIGYQLARESHQALHLFRSRCGHTLIKRPDVAILKTLQEGIRTVRIATHLHQTRADTHEEHTVFLVLRVELGHNNVHGRLGGSVQSTDINLAIVGQVEVGKSGGYGNDLLGLTLQDKRVEEVEEVDVADDIGLQ
jgi:hypothetical protein